MTYSTGTIYKIVCSLDENVIYIGSTYNQLRHRWQKHKSNYKEYLEGKHGCISIYPYFEKFGIENFKIMRIKDYECYRGNKSDSKHLQAYEQLWINKTRCVNKISTFSIPIVAKQKKKEKGKEYREANREKLSENRKEYYEANREKISEKKKENYQANREKISEYRKANREVILEKSKEYYQANQEKISEYRKANREVILEKSKEYYQANRRAKLEKNKEYYQANRRAKIEKSKEYRKANQEKILEKRKEYYQANQEKILEKSKERVNCDICDKEFARGSLNKHKKRIHNL